MNGGTTRRGRHNGGGGEGEGEGRSPRGDTKEHAALSGCTNRSLGRHRKESAIKRITKLIAVERAVYGGSLFYNNNLPRACYANDEKTTKE